MFPHNEPKKKVVVGEEGIAIERITLIHFTRVDDVMCCKHFSFLFLVHQEIAGSKCG